MIWPGGSRSGSEATRRPPWAKPREERPAKGSLRWKLWAESRPPCSQAGGGGSVAEPMRVSRAVGL